MIQLEVEVEVEMEEEEEVMQLEEWMEVGVEICNSI